MRTQPRYPWRLKKGPIIIFALIIIAADRMPRAEAHPPFAINANLTVDWGDEKTCDLTIELKGTRINYAEPVEPQRILVEVEDINGNLIGSSVIDETYTQATPQGGEQIDKEEQFTVQPDSRVHQVRFRWWDNGTDGEAAGFQLKTIDDYCPNIQSESELNTLIACGDCGGQPESLEESAINVYKSTRTVYALRLDDESDATYGETVSGSFKAPKCGILKVEVVSGTNNNVEAFLEEWNGDGTPAGSGTVKVKKMDKDDLYKFSIRAHKGDQQDVIIKFDWYTWKDNKSPGTEEDCLKHYEYQTGGNPGLIFQIQAILYKEVPVVEGVPLILKGKMHEAEGTNWYELEIPICGDDGENMTEMFILDINSDGGIANGHAVGWTKAGATMIAPDPDGEVYDISGF